jgi:hypothetical protein
MMLLFCIEKVKNVMYDDKGKHVWHIGLDMSSFLKFWFSCVSFNLPDS